MDCHGLQTLPNQSVGQVRKPTFPPELPLEPGKANFSIMFQSSTWPDSLSCQMVQLGVKQGLWRAERVSDYFIWVNERILSQWTEFESMNGLFRLFSIFSPFSTFSACEPTPEYRKYDTRRYCTLNTHSWMSPRMPAPISFLFPTPSFALSFAAHLSIYFWTCSPLFWLLCLLCLFMYYVLFLFLFCSPRPSRATIAWADIVPEGWFFHKIPRHGLVCSLVFSFSHFLHFSIFPNCFLFSRFFIGFSLSANKLTSQQSRPRCFTHTWTTQ